MGVGGWGVGKGMARATALVPAGRVSYISSVLHGPCSSEHLATSCTGQHCVLCSPVLEASCGTCARQ